MRVWGVHIVCYCNTLHSLLYGTYNKDSKRHLELMETYTCAHACGNFFLSSSFSFLHPLLRRVVTELSIL
jgi:hypothetical protein